MCKVKVKGGDIIEREEVSSPVQTPEGPRHRQNYLGGR